MSGARKRSIKLSLVKSIALKIVSAIFILIGEFVLNF